MESIIRGNIVKMSTSKVLGLILISLDLIILVFSIVGIFLNKGHILIPWWLGPLYLLIPLATIIVGIIWFILFITKK